MLATGEAKAEALEHFVAGVPDPAWPASFLADHPELEVLVDPPAGGQLG